MIPAPQPFRRSLRGGLVATSALAVVLALAGCSESPAGSADVVPSTPRESATSASTPGDPDTTVTAPTVDPALPLAGRVVVLDPGHQLGNAAFPAEIDEPVDAGGFEKPCNTTGTSTDAGYPEATFTWEVAR